MMVLMHAIKRYETDSILGQGALKVLNAEGSTTWFVTAWQSYSEAGVHEALGLSFRNRPALREAHG
jgi:hypothetical protein